MPMSMSAADWTRLQRQKAGTQYVAMVRPSATPDQRFNKDIAPTMPLQAPYGNDVMSTRFAGKPKTLRPASDWTNFTASQVSDYVLKSGGTGRAGETFENQNYTTMRVTRLCSCVTNVLNPKRTSCDACAIGQHMRLG